MKTTIYVPDIECDSCVRIIKKALDKTEGIDSFAIKQDHIEIMHGENIKQDDLVDVIKSKRFRASLEPFDRKTVSERIRDMRENKHKYGIELKVFSYAISIFLMLCALDAIAYFLFLKNIPDFIPRYGWWIFYLNISVSTTAMGIWHTLAYRAKVTCMVGMMIGMTIGMQSGMMIGAVIGATNGFFIGSMTGMLIGTIVGAITGRCCGVMGIMEGMMAGVMGGTMGPMITVMMFSDHVLIFMPFYIAINVAILWGLSFMLYEEVVEYGESVEKKPTDFATLASITIIATVLLMMIILYAPKSIFIGG
ncbi:hypothetical protein H6503_03690 [Candidatus Woesearchaeota archaeon]|nr:hypothetical protein [Candidatus Woesearchaeota archaeon]